MSQDTLRWIVELLAQVAVAAFVYGQLTRAVKDLVGWVKRVDQGQDVLSNQVMDHEGRISSIEGRMGIQRGGG